MNMLRLKEKYNKEVIPEMKKKFGFKSTMSVPKIVKVVVNTGFGKIIAGKSGDEQKKIADAIVKDMSLICGQYAALTRAKKSIAAFKLREGTPLGARSTLRGKKMEDFLDRLIHIVLPRSRDFRGLHSKSIDEKGNFTIGIEEHIFFPEISPEKVRNSIGLEITVVTSAKNKEQGLALLHLLGFPIA